MNLAMLSLPLLTKELIEQAQSKRTYILRVVYAVILYGFALFQYSGVGLPGGPSGLMNFGRGHDLFGQLVAIQAALIFLLLPAITSGALTIEKEKDTLAILLLTKLKPWTIIFEKYFSRILAMGTYQLLSLPLFAIIYGMGGVELYEVTAAIGMLISVTMFVAAVSILCSTWFRTTSTAFVMTYVAILLSYLMIAQQLRWLFFGGLGSDNTLILFAASSGQYPSPFKAFIWSLLSFPVMGSLVCLLVASKALVERAFVKPRNLVLEFFHHADTFFQNLNESTTGGIILVNDSVKLPESNPIAWRETQKKSLGTFRYQFRVLMFLLTPLIYTISLQLQDPVRDFTLSFHQYPVFFWIVSTVCLIIHSTGAIPSERVRQTFEVLLVLPISSESIIRQKLSGVRRMIFILSLPFVVLVITQAIWVGYVATGITTTPSLMAGIWVETVTTGLCVVFYMPVIVWTGFQLGLRLRTQMQAVISTCAIIGVMCALPPMLKFLGDMIVINNQHGPAALRVFGSAIASAEILSPMAMITHQMIELQFINVVRSEPTIWLQDLWGLIAKVVCHFTFYGVLWWALRRNALRSFSRLVGRVEPAQQGIAATVETMSVPSSDAH